MKQLRCWFISTVFLVCLFGGRAALSQTDILNLEAYPEGASVPYGENVIVRMDERTGDRWLTHKPGGGDGSLTFNVTLSGNIEIIVSVGENLTSHKTYLQFSLTADDGREIFWERYPQYSGIDQHPSWRLQDGTDSASIRNRAATTKLSITGYTAKLYDNKDNFLTKIVLAEPNTTYSQLKVTGLSYDDKGLYKLTAKSSGGVNPPPITDFELGKEAGRQECVANPTLCGLYSSADFQTAKQEGKLECINDPASCGLFSGTNVADAREEGRQGCIDNPASCGISCSANPQTTDGTCEPVTLSSDFKMHIPSLQYSSMVLWAELELREVNELLFKVTDFGIIEEGGPIPEGSGSPEEGIYKCTLFGDRNGSARFEVDLWHTTNGEMWVIRWPQSRLELEGLETVLLAGDLEIERDGAFSARSGQAIYNPSPGGFPGTFSLSGQFKTGGVANGNWILDWAVGSDETGQFNCQL